MENSELLIISIFFLLLLLFTRSYAYGLSMEDTFINFFSQPRAFLVYGLIVLVGVAPVLQWLPASVWMFVAGVILYLTAAAGGA